uniref:Uncharacterized protein n=1 Tax=Anguilla anguilla TaxID=7936 RepID=A0A0E9S444_ANGAN
MCAYTHGSDHVLKKYGMPFSFFFETT